MNIKTPMDYSEYTVTVKTDCSYWGDDTDRESANRLAREHGAKIEAALTGINIRYCDMIGHGNADNTDGPDGGVCEKIDSVLASLLLEPGAKGGAIVTTQPAGHLPSLGAINAAYAILKHPEVECGIFQHIAVEFAEIIDRETSAPDLLAALEAIIDAAQENATELVGRHMRTLGTTTTKNLNTANRLIADLKAIQDARAAIDRANGAGGVIMSAYNPNIHPDVQAALENLGFAPEQVSIRYSDVQAVCKTHEQARKLCSAGQWRSTAEVFRVNPDHPDAKLFPWGCEIPFAALGEVFAQKASQTPTP